MALGLHYGRRYINLWRIGLDDWMDAHFRPDGTGEYYFRGERRVWSNFRYDIQRGVRIPAGHFSSDSHSSEPRLTG